MSLSTWNRTDPCVTVWGSTSSLNRIVEKLGTKLPSAWCVHLLCPRFVVYVGMKCTRYLAIGCCTPVSLVSGCQLPRSASRHQFTVLHYRLNTFGHLRAFSVAGPTSWNSLPARLHDIILSSDSFRKLLKRELFASFLNTLNAVEMFHDSVLYKFTIDIDIAHVRRVCVWQRRQHVRRMSSNALTAWPGAYLSPGAVMAHLTVTTFRTSMVAMTTTADPITLRVVLAANASTRCGSATATLTVMMAAMKWTVSWCSIADADDRRRPHYCRQVVITSRRNVLCCRLAKRPCSKRVNRLLFNMHFGSALQLPGNLVSRAIRSRSGQSRGESGKSGRSPEKSMGFYYLHSYFSYSLENFSLTSVVCWKKHRFFSSIWHRKIVCTC